MILTTKALAKMIGVCTGTAIDIGQRHKWKCRPDPYSSSGFLWEVSEWQLEEYKIIRARSGGLTIEQRRERMQAVLDTWDTAFFGRKFPSCAGDINLKKFTISYVHLQEPDTEPLRTTKYKHEYREPPLCPKCDGPRLRNSYGSFYAYCRDHHNEMQREAGKLFRARRKAQKLAEKETFGKKQQIVVDNSALHA